MAAGTVCTFDASDTSDFPFEYLSANASKVKTGRYVSVAGYDEPVCIFEQADCKLGIRPTAPDGTAFQCCQSTNDLQSAAQVWLYPLIAFAGLYVLGFIWIAYRKNQAKKKGLPPPPPPRFGLGVENAPLWVRVAMTATMFAAIGAVVAEAVIMPKSIQQNLTPADGAARLAMSAFLTPVNEIFSFLEDAMVVKVGYALATKRYDELNMLLHVSVLGGLISGIVAFLMMLLFSSVETTAGALLNPSSASNDALIEGGCGLIPTTAELLSKARVFWLLSAASWIPQFATAGVKGFMAGTGNLGAYLAPMVIMSTVPIGLWFGLLPETHSTDGSEPALAPLSLLGISQGTAPWLVAIAMFVYLGCNKRMHRDFQLRFLGCGGAHIQGLWATVRDVTKEGLELMVVDLAVQMSLTVTTYLAAKHDMETAYKIAAAQAAYWGFGPSYMVGIMLFLKVSGSRLVASGKFRQFVGGFVVALVIATTLALVAVFSAYSKRVPVAFDYGESACIFASDAGCAPVYAGIFVGQDSLAKVFEAFGPTVGLNMLFMAFRAGLATCHDFAFMAKASVVTLLLVYVPVIIAVDLAMSEHLAMGYYLAMYAPHFAMIVVFGYRMKGHLSAMLNDRPGPWTDHTDRMSKAISVSDIAQVRAAIPSVNSASAPLLAGGDQEITHLPTGV